MRADHLNDRQGEPRGSLPDVEGDERAHAEAGDCGAARIAPAREPSNIFEILRSRVRTASDGQLVIAASLGVAGFVALGAVRRWPWAAVAACCVLVGAGLWGVLDRVHGVPVLLGRAIPLPFVSLARVTSGAIALLSLLALLLGAFGLCLGTWIS